jgi:hypothetical protein
MLLARLLVGAFAVACDNTASVTGPPRSVALVHLSPRAASIMVGQTMQLTATAMDANGNPLVGRAVSWAPSDTTLAKVDPTGLTRACGSAR